MQKHRFDIRDLAGVKIAAVGSGTARTLEQHDLYPDCVPEIYTVAALAEELIQRLSSRDRVALIRCREGSADIFRELGQSGIEYRDLAVYEIAADPVTVKNFTGRADFFDYIVFGSSAGVRAYFDSTAQIGAHCRPVCVGPVTAAALACCCSGRIITASEHSTAGVASAIISDWRYRRNENKTQTPENQ